MVSTVKSELIKEMENEGKEKDGFCSGFPPGPVQPLIGAFCLQAPEKALHDGIIPAIPLPAHAADHAVLLE